ncbi:MAG: hypothetical protein KBI32_07195 [Phycisphaerae bacterium]|nr:hypothetical protein [Phycisphaerae bacterium]
MQAISRTVFVVSMMAGLWLAVAKAGDAARFVVSPKGGKVEFAPASPARRLGIEPIDVSDAGPRLRG